MALISAVHWSQDALKKIVLDDLAGKMGMDGPTFDKWLEMPSAT